MQFLTLKYNPPESSVELSGEQKSLMRYHIPQYCQLVLSETTFFYSG